jgi:DNA-binding HxlR family transcriptional regulator
MTIRVTSRDIKRGQRRLNDCCPVALALRRHFPHSAVRVHWSALELLGEMRPMAKRVQRWVHRYDDGLSVRPFEFTLPRRAQIPTR